MANGFKGSKAAAVMPRASGRERRRDERLMVQDVLTGELVAGNGRLVKIELNDISKGGISFYLRGADDILASGEVAKLNLIFNDSKKFFQCFFKIKNVRKDLRNRFMYNGQITEDSMNKNAVGFLVKFIQAVRVATA